MSLDEGCRERPSRSISRSVCLEQSPCCDRQLAARAPQQLKAKGGEKDSQGMAATARDTTVATVHFVIVQCRGIKTKLSDRECYHKAQDRQGTSEQGKKEMSCPYSWLWVRSKSLQGLQT